MNTLQRTVTAILDKVSQLLLSEPVRLIVYGATAVVMAMFAIAKANGITNLGDSLTEEQAATAVAFALGLVIAVVEAMRQFVVSPQTYIEDLADEASAAHEAAHAEEDARRIMEGIVEEAKAEVAKQRKARVAVGTVKASDADKDLKN